MRIKGENIILGLIVAAVVIIYGSLWNVGFLTWDDGSNIANNPWYRAGQWSALWKEPYFGLYVPVTSAFWGILYQLGGAAAWPFRIANVFLHVLNTTLVFFLLRAFVNKLRLPTLAVLIGTAVFALHPQQAGAVAWISGGRDLLAATFALLAVIFVWRGNKGYILASLLFILALFSKPNVAVLPAAIVILVWMMEGTVSRRRLGQMSLWALLAAYVVYITGSAQAEHVAAGTEIARRPLLLLDSYAFYLRRLLWPFELTANYGQTPEVVHAKSAWTFVVAAALLASMGALVWRSGRSYRGFSLIWLLLILPVSGVAAFGFQRISGVADHYAYLPMAAAGMLLFGTIFSRIPQRASVAVTVVLILGLSFLSWNRAQVWRSDEALFTDMALTAPDSYATAIGMSVVSCTKKLDFENGVKWTDKALAARPDDITALSNKAYCFLHAGKFDEVIALQLITKRLDFKVLAATWPTPFSSFLATLGTALIERNFMEAGYQYLCEAYEIYPVEPNHVVNLSRGGEILRAKGLTPTCQKRL